MKKIFMFMFAVAAATLVWGASAHADLDGPQKGRVGGELIFWFPTINGDASFSGFDTGLGIDIPGTDLDIDDVMGIDQSEMTIEIGLWVNPLKRHRLSLFWFIDQRTGSNTLNLNDFVNVDGVGISGDIDSNLEFQRWRLLYELAIIRNDLGRLAVSSGVTYIDVIASITGTENLTGLRRSVGDRLQIPLPVVGGSAELHIPFLKGLGVFVEGVGFGISYAEISASYIEARGGVNFKTRYAFVQAGYQYMDLSGEAFNSFDVSFNLQGPFASVGAKF